MVSALPLAPGTIRCRYGTLPQVTTSSPIAVILPECMLSPGPPMDNVLPRQAEVIPVLVIRPCRYGMPVQEILSSPITVILMEYMLWGGHLMASILPRQARIRLYRYGTPLLAKPT